MDKDLLAPFRLLFFVVVIFVLYGYTEKACINIINIYHEVNNYTYIFKLNLYFLLEACLINCLPACRIDIIA